MQRAALLILLAATALPALETRVALVGGVAKHEGDLKELAGDRGWAVGLYSMQRGGASIVGIPGIDIDWRTGKGDGGSYDAVGIYYTERAPILSWLYLGGGVGTAWGRIKHTGGQNDSDWQPGLKGMGGLMFGDDIFIEVAYHAQEPINHTSLRGYTLCLGIWF